MVSRGQRGRSRAATNGIACRLRRGSLSLISRGRVSQLIVRDLEEELVVALRARAAAHGRSAEAEHREILRQVLLRDERAEAFKTWLMSMPAVGDDADFERHADLPRDVDL